MMEDDGMSESDKKNNTKRMITKVLALLRSEAKRHDRIMRHVKRSKPYRDLIKNLPLINEKNLAVGRKSYGG